MTAFQRVIKYFAIFVAFSLCVSIFAGIATAGLAIVGAFGLLGNQSENYVTTNVDIEVASLEVKIGASELEITTGEKLVIDADENRMNVVLNGNKILIEEKNTKIFSGFLKKSKLKIQIPRDYVFETAKIDSGVGKVSTDGLKAKDLSLSLGVGEVEMKNLTVEGADIDCGIGKVTLELTGVETDYKFKVDHGLGAIYLNDEKVDDDATIEKGDYKIDVDGGIGEVNIRTAAEKKPEVESPEKEDK